MRVAGFGFRGSASVASLHDAYERAGGAADALATVTEKAGAPALREFAAVLGLGVIPVAPSDIAATETPTQSARVAARFGAGSLAEAAALAAAGPGARLTGPRQVSGDGMATAAIAERDDE